MEKRVNTRRCNGNGSDDINASFVSSCSSLRMGRSYQAEARGKRREQRQRQRTPQTESNRSGQTADKCILLQRHLPPERKLSRGTRNAISEDRVVLSE